jgi:hypothetical protein
MAVGIQLRSGLVIDHVIGAENVVAIVNDDLSSQGPDVSHPALMLCLPPNGSTGGWRSFGLRERKNLLAGVLREWSFVLLRTVMVGWRSLLYCGR